MAILLGASSWCAKAGYKPAPEFAASAAGLRDYIRSPQGLDVPERRVLDLFDSQDSAETQLRRLRTFLTDSLADTSARKSFADLFVYAVSHGEGTRQNRHDLHLIVHATESGFVDGTGLSVRQLAASLIRTAQGLRRYIILDCCFAGAALAHFQSGAEGVAKIVAADIRRTASEVADPAEGLVEVTSGAAASAAIESTGYDQMRPDRSWNDNLPPEGTVLFCSSRADDLSLAKAKDGRTLFTSSVLRVLASGAAPDGTSRDTADVEHGLISFARLRDRAWRLMWSEVGESAPYPQLYAPVQQRGDLCTLPLLPLLTTGKRAIVRQPKRTGWRAQRRTMVVAIAGCIMPIAAIGVLVVGMTGLWPRSPGIPPLPAPVPPADLRGAIPVDVGVASAMSSSDLRTITAQRSLYEHTADCKTVKLTRYPEALNVTFKDIVQAANPCSIGPHQSINIKFQGGIRAFGITYTQGLYYAEITMTLKDGRSFTQTRPDFLPNLNYVGMRSDSDIDVVSIRENNVGFAALEAVTFYSLQQFKRVFESQ